VSSCYVPRYLEFGPRQADGWPDFVAPDTKRWCVEKVGWLVNFWKEHRRDWCDLEHIRQVIFTAPDRPTELRGVALWDAQYAVAHRAALAADLVQVWTSRRS